MATTRHGFNEVVQNVKYLDQIWDIVMEKYFVEANGLSSITLLDEAKEDKKILELNKKLTKPFYKYTSSKFYTVYWYKEVKAREEKERLKEEKKKEAKRQLDEKMEMLAEEYGNKWRDEYWIKKNIGEYYTYEPIISYFWTLIGDNWKVKDWKHNIELEKSIYNKIKSMKVEGFKGSSFLNRKFKNRSGYSCGIDGCYQVEQRNEPYGIYGIYLRDELIYIGSTMRSFEIRMREHIENIKLGSKELYLYSLLSKEDLSSLSWSPLIDCKELKANKTFTAEDVQSMELALISLYKPKGNLAGVSEEFRYKGYAAK